MSKICDLTGKGVVAGNNIAHSNTKTKRRFRPNLQNVTLLSESLGRKLSLRIATSTLRTVQKRGGLDAFLLATDDAKLPPRALRIKRSIQRAHAK
jgi:large subunit ribosomal protein L28